MSGRKTTIHHLVTVVNSEKALILKRAKEFTSMSKEIFMKGSSSTVDSTVKEELSSITTPCTKEISRTEFLTDSASSSIENLAE